MFALESQPVPACLLPRMIASTRDDFMLDGGYEGSVSVRRSGRILPSPDAKMFRLAALLLPLAVAETCAPGDVRSSVGF